MQSEASKEVVNRFFETLDHMVEAGKLSSLFAFCRDHKINRWNFNTLKKEHERDIMQLEWLTILVKKYGVSADYLLTGEGKRYSKEIFIQPNGYKLKSLSQKMDAYISANKIQASQQPM